MILSVYQANSEDSNFLIPTINCSHGHASCQPSVALLTEHYSSHHHFAVPLWVCLGRKQWSRMRIPIIRKKILPTRGQIQISKVWIHIVWQLRKWNCPPLMGKIQWNDHQGRNILWTLKWKILHKKWRSYWFNLLRETEDDLTRN